MQVCSRIGTPNMVQILLYLYLKLQEWGAAKRLILGINVVAIRGQKFMNDFHAEIAVLLRPKDARSHILYNVPLNTKRAIKLYIHPKVGSNFSVEILQPQSGWLKLSQYTGKIPFTTTVTIDTTGLEPVSVYKEELVFTVNGVEIHKEPIFLSTQLYDPSLLQGDTLVRPLNPGTKKKNFLISILTSLEVIRNFVVAFIFLWLLLLGLLIIMLIVSVAASG